MIVDLLDARPLHAVVRRRVIALKPNDVIVGRSLFGVHIRARPRSRQGEAAEPADGVEPRRCQGEGKPPYL